MHRRAPRKRCRAPGKIRMRWHAGISPVFEYFTVARNLGCLVSDRVILSGPSYPDRTEPSRGPSCPDAPLEIS